MYPILFTIPLGWPTYVVVALLFAIGGVVRARFAPGDKDGSYLASFLGLHVKWGVVAAPWSTALIAGAQQGAISAGLVYVLSLAAKRMSPNAAGLPLHTYGVMMALGFIVGIFLATRQATHEGLPPVPLRDDKGRPVVVDGKPQLVSAADMVSDLTFWLLVSGLVGSRILYIITRWEAEYSRNPARILYIWEGGLVWYGGLIGATATAFWFAKKHGISFMTYADIIVPSVSLGHGLGRLGCFAAGCCFGNVADAGFPLTLEFPGPGPGMPNGSPAFAEHLGDGLITAASAASLPVYPVQIIEAAGEALIFFTLLFVRSRKRFHGQVVLTYFSIYPLLRFVTEMFRGDSIRAFLLHWPEKGHEMLLSTSQFISILIAIAGIVVTTLLVRSRNRAIAAA